MNFISKHFFYLAFLTSISTISVSSPSYPEILTDKPYYLSGEQLYYNIVLNTADYFLKRDKIFYAELLSEDGSLINRHILMIENGSSSGVFSLDPQLKTAWYGLRVYSFEMIQQPYKLPVRKILIWNRDDPFSEDLEVFHNVSADPEERINQNQITHLNLSTDKIRYSTRSQIKVFIDPTDLIQTDESLNLTITARYARYFPPYEMFSENNVPLKINSDDEVLPVKGSVLSRDRLLLRGHAIQESDTESKLYQLVTYSTLGKDPYIEYEYTNKKGDFVFDISHITSDREILYMSTLNEGSNRIDIQKVSYPDVGIQLPAAVSEMWIESLKQYINNAKIRQRIVENYNIAESTVRQKDVSIFDTTRVYKTADNTYKLSDYVDFRDMNEVTREILLYVKQHDGGRRLSIYNRTNPDLNDKPLFLINGMPTRDHSYVIDMDVSNIDVIEILYSKKALLPFGWIGRGGILAIYTHQPVEVPGIQKFTIQGLHSGKTQHKYQFDESTINHPVPIFDPLPFWQADLAGKVSETDTVHFYTGDETGELEIIVFGVDKNGKRYYGHKTVEIEMNE